MEILRGRQADLFDVASSLPRKMGVPRTPFFERFSLTFRLDHLLFLGIGAMVAGVWVYSAGYDAGKQGAAATVKKIEAKYTAQVEDLRAKVDGLASMRVNVIEPVAAPAVQIDGDSVREPETPAIPGDGVVTTFQSETTTTRATRTITERRQDGKYTIQVLTYKTESAATRQIQKLEEKGFDGFVIPSGEYYQVCANAFESKTTAKKTLESLQSSGLAPSDAFVRSIVR